MAYENLFPPKNSPRPPSKTDKKALKRNEAFIILLKKKKEDFVRKANPIRQIKDVQKERNYIKDDTPQVDPRHPNYYYIA